MTTVQFLVAYWGDPSLLDAAVDSVVAQDDPHWTLTIVDDGFPDPHASVVYGSHADERITYLRNETNLGVAGNFERCRTLATGDLVVFLGCDDLLRPDFVSFARRTRAEVPGWTILQPGVEVIDEHDAPANGLTERIKAALAPRRPATLEGEELAVSLLRGNWLYWPSLVFEREALARHSFRQDYPIILDLALVIDLVLDGAVLEVRSDVTFAYRRHSASASSTSLLEGSRLPDERRFFTETAARLQAHGWKRAARISRWHLVSRLQALASLPGALRLAAARRTAQPVATVLRHVLGR